MKSMEDRADVESAQSEGWRTWIEFNVVGQNNKQKKKKTAEAKAAWASKQQGSETGMVEAEVLLAGSMVWWVMSWSVRLAKRERGSPTQECRSEKENERIVQKMHSEQPAVTKKGKTASAQRGER